MRPADRPLKILVLVLAGAVLLASPHPADAQMGGREQVEEYLQKTEDLILWARDLVAETESGPARRVLQGAADLHQRSRHAMEGGRPVQALEISRRARTAAYHAVRLAREAMGLEERIRIRAERFDDEHRQLTERAREVGFQPALELLDRARRKADRARELYRQGDFQLSWKLLEQAGDMNRRAARMLADLGGPIRLDRDIERTEERLARTEEALGARADPAALDLLEQARSALDEARRARDQGQPGRALQLTCLANRLADQAGRLGGLGPDPEAVRDQIDRFDERFGRLAERVRESGSEPAREALEEARRHRERAAQHLADGETEEALRRIRAGHDLLGRAEDLMRP